MPTSDDLALVDTNVLIGAVFQDTEHHVACRALLERAQSDAAGLCVFPQVMCEFFAIATDAKRVSVPKTPQEALEAIEALLALPGLTLLPVPHDVVFRLVDLVRRIPVKGPKVFDLQLVAAMLGQGIRRVYTFNARDFTKFTELEVVSP